MDSTEHILLIIQLTNEINIHIIGPTQIFHEVVSSSLGSIQLLTQLTINSDSSLEINNCLKYLCHVYTFRKLCALFTEINVYRCTEIQIQPVSFSVFQVNSIFIVATSVFWVFCPFIAYKKSEKLTKFIKKLLASSRKWLVNIFSVEGGQVLSLFC